MVKVNHCHTGFDQALKLSVIGSIWRSNHPLGRGDNRFGLVSGIAPHCLGVIRLSAYWVFKMSIQILILMMPVNVEIFLYFI